MPYYSYLIFFSSFPLFSHVPLAQNMKNIIAITILIILNLTIVSASNDDRNNYYDIVTLGAKPNSKSDSSKALKMAWDMACDSPGQSTINIPEGRFNIRKPLKLDGKGCLSSRIDVIINGTIVAPSDFHVLQDSGTLVLFHDVDGVTVTGGLFDGRGAKLWACKRSGNDDCPRGVTVRSNTSSVFLELRIRSYPCEIKISFLRM